MANDTIFRKPIWCSGPLNEKASSHIVFNVDGKVISSIATSFTKADWSIISIDD